MSTTALEVSYGEDKDSPSERTTEKGEEKDNQGYNVVCGHKETQYIFVC